MSIQSQKKMESGYLETRVLGQMGVMRPGRRRSSMSTEAQLTLTSLVDAFTILVIYLLVATNIGAPDVQIASDITLPKATHAKLTIPEATITVRNGQTFLDQQSIDANQLVDELLKLKENLSARHITIIADKDENFEGLNPLVLASLQAGFEEVRFAALQEEDR